MKGGRVPAHCTGLPHSQLLAPLRRQATVGVKRGKTGHDAGCVLGRENGEGRQLRSETAGGPVKVCPGKVATTPAPFLDSRPGSTNDEAPPRPPTKEQNDHETSNVYGRTC